MDIWKKDIHHMIVATMQHRLLVNQIFPDIFWPGLTGHIDWSERFGIRFRTNIIQAFFNDFLTVSFV